MMQILLLKIFHGSAVGHIVRVKRVSLIHLLHIMFVHHEAFVCIDVPLHMVSLFEKWLKSLLEKFYFCNKMILKAFVFKAMW